MLMHFFFLPFLWRVTQIQFKVEVQSELGLKRSQSSQGSREVTTVEIREKEKNGERGFVISVPFSFKFFLDIKKTWHFPVLHQSLLEIFHLQTSPKTLKNLILHSATFLPPGVRSCLNQACPASLLCTNYTAKSQALLQNKELTAFSIKQLEVK